MKVIRCLLVAGILALTGCGIAEKKENIEAYYQLEQRKLVEKHLQEMDLDTLTYLSTTEGAEFVEIKVQDHVPQTSIIRIYYEDGVCDRRLLPLLTEEERGQLEEAFSKMIGIAGSAADQWGSEYVQLYAEIAKQHDYLLYPCDRYRED